MWRLNCYLNPKPFKVYIHLGRFGDLMILLPGWHHEWKETGRKQVVMVSEYFAPMLDGVSYVEPWVVPYNWNTGLQDATAHCQYELKRLGVDAEVVIPKWWDNPRATPPPPPADLSKAVSLSFHGRNFLLDPKYWESYMSSQWVYAGWPKDKILEWPLVFDRRDSQREMLLQAVTFHTRKPKLLYNFSGATNPFPYTSFLLPMMNSFMDRVELIDLSQIRAERIQDLLGLYDVSIGMITGDTATLHLAGASQMRYIALLAEGGGGSLPRGNCVKTIRYSDARQNITTIYKTIQEWIANPQVTANWVEKELPPTEEKPKRRKRRTVDAGV